jgi:xanthine dehydrogenase YagS FAD-binding subunit
MPPFTYHAATSLADATDRLADAHAAPLGGGTDLLVAIEEGLAAPALLVDLRRIPDATAITLRADGSLRIGGAARLCDIAGHEAVRDRWPALAQACEAVGTPTIRQMGTLGGNLCQRPRCWYFRQGIACHKRGGDRCPAEREGAENQYHAIVNGGPCHAVHPSDPAVALTVLSATIELSRRGGSRMVPVEEFFVLPARRPDRETVVEPGEVVSAVSLPAASAGGRQFYHKLMQREAWDFALVSIAGARRASGEVRMAMGGVAPAPWRVNSSVEEDVASGGLDEDSIAALAERALYDAAPLSRNGYKVQLAGTLLRRAMHELAG